MPLFLTQLLQWLRRRPLLAFLVAGGVGWFLYDQMTAAPALPLAKKLAQAGPGLSGQRVTLEKTLLDVQGENERLRLTLEEQRQALLRLDQAQQRQERRLEEAQAQAQQRAQAQRPSPPAPSPAPPPPPRVVRAAAASPRPTTPPARSGAAPTIRILKSDKPPSFSGPGPTLLPPSTAPYLPPGSYAVGTLVTGVLASSRTDGALPVLFAVSAPFAGPFQVALGTPPVATALPVQGCLVLGKAQGDLASLRVIVQLTTLSCVFPDGHTFERPLVGYATGADGTLGLPGKLETREGTYLAKTFLTSLLAGAGEAFALAKRTVVVTPFGGTVSTQNGNVGEMAGYSALAEAASRLSDWYLGQANKLLPVLWAESGMSVRLVLQEGLALDGLPTTATLQEGR